MTNKSIGYTAMDNSWKAFERRLAKDMGVTRQPVTGDRAAGDTRPHELFTFQFKLRRSVPRWLFHWLDGIVQTAIAEDKIGILVLKRPHLRDADALVVLRWHDWRLLHGDGRWRGQKWSA